MGIEDGGSQFSPDDLVESYMAADEKPNQALVLREVTEPAVATPATSLAAHPGIGSQRFTDEQQKIIERIPEDDDIDILPTGEIYYGQVQYRRRLNEAFGPGGWGLIPVGNFLQDGETLCREYALVCEGRIVSTAIGETDFQPNNARFSKATAAESVKSIALRRTAKDIGIADDCWDKRFIKRWLDKNAVRVWTVGVAANNKGQKKPMWRRKDAEPFDYPWREENAAAKREAAKAPEAGAQEPLLDPNQKWKEWAASAMKQDRTAFIEMLGAHGFETPAEVTNRDMQKAIFKEWNGKGTEEA